MKVQQALTKGLIAISLLMSLVVNAKELDYYLPQDVSYDPQIPTPESVLGYQVGDWHVRHDQMVSYIRLLAEKSPRMSLEQIGQSHEQRPLLLLKVANPDTITQLETVRTQHLDGVSKGHSDSQPVVVWMGFSVHGNEPSGANASLLLAYYLAAVQGEKIEQLLNSSVILMETAINPDGLARFAQWANMHKGQNLVADPNHREHIEDWPSGRTNHYWFDLNRDWLLLTHPESRARIKQLHRWQPNVVTDFHEMGPNSTYFFQPGIPSRTNPLTPEKNVQLTATLAKYHAKALDNINSLYFTQESFDDFYMGKGSTYPDLQGSVGILFEQASSRGHLQNTINGRLSFPFTIKNQVTTSLSTLQGALIHKKELLNYQNKFFDSALSEAKKDSLAGYLISESDDKGRLNDLLGLLSQHQIKAYALNEDLSLKKQKFSRHHSYFVPLQQPQYRLIKSIFSTQKNFPDNTFYDVSSWNLAYSFNIDFQPVKRSSWRSVSYNQSAWSDTDRKAIENQLPASYAYAFKWHDYYAPKLLSRLLSAGVKLRASSDSFVAQTNAGSMSFAAGSIVIPRGLEQPENFVELIQQQANELNVKVHAIESGLTPQGIDLGSRKMYPVNKPKILIVGGRGVSQYEAGELWHYLDTRVDLAATIVEKHRLANIRLKKYSHIVMVNGRYNFNEKLTDKIKSWVKQGGVLIGQKSGAKWMSKEGLVKAEFLAKKDYDAAFDTEGLQYKDKEGLAGRKRIAGAVMQYQLDQSHPLTFGFEQQHLPVFRNSNAIMLAAEASFTNVALYTEKPLLAGYTSLENQELLKGSAGIIAHRNGNGRVIAFADNVNFRGVWRGTSHLMANAIFFADMITVSASNNEE